MYRSLIKFFHLLLVLMSLCSVAVGQSLDTETISIYSSELPPYIGSQADRQGAVAELLRALVPVQENGLDLAFFPAARALAAAKDDKAFAAVYFTIDGQRIEQPHVTAPILTVDFVNVSAKTDKHLALEDTPSVVVGLARGPVSHAVQSLYSEQKFNVVNSEQQLIRMLGSGRLDSAFIEEFAATSLMVEYFPQFIGELHFDKRKVIRVNIRLAMTGEAPERKVSEFNKTLDKIRSNGEYDRILETFGLLASTQEENPTGKTLRIATVDNHDMRRLELLSKIYERSHPGIKLEWTLMSEESLRLRLLSNHILGNAQFDVISIGAHETPIQASRGWLRPFRKLQKGYDYKDILQPIRRFSKYKGQTFSLPFYGESSALFYRKDLFKKHGLHMPKQPTYDDIERFAERLNAPEDQIYGICLRTKPGFGANVSVLVPMINSYGGRWFDMEWTPQLTSEAWRAAIERYIKLLRNWGPPLGTDQGSSYLENLELTAKGRCAMWVDATVAAGVLFDEIHSSVHDKIAITRAPIQKSVVGYHWLYAWSFAIPKDSRSPDLAQDFIAWATSKNYQQITLEEFGPLSIPPGVRYSSYRNRVYLKSASFAPMVLDLIEAANPNRPSYLPTPYIGIQTLNLLEFPAIGNYVGWQIHNALKGDIGVSQALNNANQFISQLKINEHNERLDLKENLQDQPRNTVPEM